MVYDDARWTARLKDMDVWNEEDARRAAEEEIFLQREATLRARQEAVLGRTLTNDGIAGSTTLFDASVVEKRKGSVNAGKVTDDLLDFQGDKTDDFGEFQSVDIPAVEKPVEAVSPLNVLSSVVSRRGKARAEFGRVYATLAPLYISLANSNSLEEAAVFRHRKQPEEQAKLLKVLELFGRSRSVGDWTRCQKRIAWITETFERHMLTEFEEFTSAFNEADFRGYEAQDLEGKMKKYAHILDELNGGQSCIQMFIRKHPSLFIYKENPIKCLTYSS
jgi:recyclin-1